MESLSRYIVHLQLVQHFMLTTWEWKFLKKVSLLDFSGLQDHRRGPNITSLGNRAPRQEQRAVQRKSFP